MRIAIIAPSKLPIPNVRGGAIETLTTYLIDSNEKFKNFDFEVFCIKDNVAIERSKYYNKSSFHFIEENFFDYLYNKFWNLIYKISKKRILPKSRFINKVLDIVNNGEYDYMLVEGNFIQIKTLCKSEIPIIYHMHTDILNVKEPCTDFIVEKSKLVLVISDFLKQQIVRACGKSTNIQIFKNAINTNLFKKVNSIHLKEKLGIPANNKVIIYCGRLVPIKGVKELLFAFEESKLSDTTLLIVGGSNFADSKQTDYEKSLYDYVRLNNLNVIFTGYVPLIKLPEYYSIADFSVCPSICNEAAGLVIIEALACGLPVIASNLGGIPEYADKSCTMFVEYNSNFIHNLCEALIRMCNDAIRGSYAPNAHLSITGYSLDDYYNNFKQIIYDL